MNFQFDFFPDHRLSSEDRCIDPDLGGPRLRGP